MTIEEQPRKGWTRIHGFMDGFGWRRHSDELTLWDYDINRHVQLQQWIIMNDIERDQIASLIMVELEQRAIHLRDKLAKNPIRFDSFQMPIIKSGFPTKPLNELI